ncbi:MAG: hypothetical protein RIB67_07335 [Miltoncostaeaceae bacterium]
MPSVEGTLALAMTSERERVVYLQGLNCALIGHLSETDGTPRHLDLDPPARPLSVGGVALGWYAFIYGGTHVEVLLGVDHPAERLLTVGGSMRLVGRWEWAVPMARLRSAFPEETPADARRLVEAAVTERLAALAESQEPPF